VTAALVPDASWDQLEAIRRSPDFPEISAVFHHWHHLQCLLQWVEHKTGESVSGDGRCLAISETLVEELRKEQRLRDRDSATESLELRARKLLLAQLARTCPRADGWGILLWKLKRASHQLIAEPELASASIDGLIGTAIEPMLLDVLRAEANFAASGHHAPHPATAKLARRHLDIHTGQGRFTALGALLYGHRRSSLIAAVAALAFTLLAWTLQASLLHETRIELPAVLGPPPVSKTAPDAPRGRLTKDLGPVLDL
jgi:hypothetical protein